MTVDIAILLGVIVIALVLFSFEWIPPDVVAIGVIIVLVVTGVVPPALAFSGFSSDAVIMIFGLLVLTAALFRTGVVDRIGRFLIRRTGTSGNKLLLASLIAPATIGSFMSNTGATAFFVPVVISLSHRAKISASRLLMPLAFAAILTSSVTLIATSTNIVVSNLMTQNQMAPLSMFELTPVGLPILIIGLLYMYFIGRRLIPDRGSSDDLLKELGTSKYLTEVRILHNSALAGKTLAESGLGRELDLTVVRILRGENENLMPQANTYIHGGDVLLVEGQRDEILHIQHTAGMEITGDTVTYDDPDLQNERAMVVEVILLLRSPLIGRSVASVQFRERYGLQVLAISRHGETIGRKISQEVLHLGDMLLVQGDRNSISALEDGRTFRVIGTINRPRVNRRRARVAIAAFVLAILLGSLNIIPLPISVLIGVFLVFITGCITPEEAYRDVEWRALILIGSMLGVGAALDYTGAAAYLAEIIANTFNNVSPLWMLSAFFILAMFLTQPMSNQAAAAVVVPVAIQTALHLGLNPRTFAIMIAIGASASFMTPLEPSCLMVYGPGRYRFFDFLKVGAILTFVIYLLAIWLVPIYWPLR